MNDLLKDIQYAADLAAQYMAAAQANVSSRVAPEGKPEPALVVRFQRMVHSLAWIATNTKSIEAALGWASAQADNGRLGSLEKLALRVGIGEYLNQLATGVPMNQTEFARPIDVGLNGKTGALETLGEKFLGADGGVEIRANLAQHIIAGDVIGNSLNDDDLDMIREQFRRFSDDEISLHAHKWHLEDALIPIEVVNNLSELGVFGVCIEEVYGGLGLGKLAMCVITEELSRGWIAAGSLGTRSEIAAELIANGGTSAQKEQWLPKIASGEILPTAVFTEPDTGSDLGSLRTRAVKAENGNWIINGNKTWITHAARSDLMTVLVRTNPDEPGYKGLSMLLAPKRRGTPETPFPSDGLSGSDIKVLGYRGMHEFDIAFADFPVEPSGLLGDQEGQGFKQLMQTFESARIQTAARAIGVARNAYDLGLRYASERKQFGRPIAFFPRVADKLALMASEILMARELTYMAARAKDDDRRCDIEAGMAKLLAARVAWSNADASLQIHGGNGYALETEISRVLCDARILNIFEGAAEIQAQVIGRGLLSRLN